jgi:glutathione S-transferase
MLTLHDNLGSGNAYKVRLLLSHLGIPFRRIEYDVTIGETRSAEFLKINPNGRIPVLQFQDGRVLVESNAILFFLASGTDYLPTDNFASAQALQWMFFEQYSHEPNIAVARYWHHFIWNEVSADPEKMRQLDEKMAKGHEALAVMEGHLKGSDFFTGSRYGVADIALYAYTHVANEGGFDLAPYSHIKNWLRRIAAQPGHVPITFSEFAC